MKLKQDTGGLIAEQGLWYNTRDINRLAIIEEGLKSRIDEAKKGLGFETNAWTRVIAGCDSNGNTFERAGKGEKRLAGIPRKYEACTLEAVRKKTWQSMQNEGISLKQKEGFVNFGKYASNLPANISKGANLMIVSAVYGVGYELAAALANECNKLGRGAVWTTPHQLLRRERYDSTEQAKTIISRAKKATLLILAYLGTEDSNKRNRADLFDLLAERKDNRLSTVVITSSDKEDLLKKYDNDFLGLFLSDTVIADVR